MIILFEWIAAIVLFFLSIGQLSGDNYYNDYYGYHNTVNYELGAVYMVASFVAFLIAIVHTKIYDDKDDYVRPHRYDWGVWDSYNNNEHHQKYMPQQNNNNVIVVAPSSSSWTFKSSKEIISDIIKDYPKNTTIINEIKQTEIKKKPSFFNFGKKDEPKVYNTPKYDIETEQDAIGLEEALDEMDVTPDFCFIDTNSTELTHEREEIYRALSVAIMEYVPSDLRSIVNSNIVHIEQSIDNINIFYRPSKAIDMKRYIGRNSFIASIRKHLKIDEVGKIKFIEIKDPSFVEYYSENYGSKRSG